MRWIREHSKATAVLAAFAALIITVMVSHQTFGESNIFGKAAGDIINIVQLPFSYAGGFLDDRLSSVFVSSDLAAENQQLKERIRELESELTEARLLENDLAALKRLSEELSYSGLYEEYRIVTADVIALDESSGFNIFTINKGSADGVSEDAVVIDGNGLIGRVMSVGDRWSKVISVIDETNKVGFQVFRNPEWLGVLHGDGNGGLTGYMLDETVNIREGDRLITSGIGGIYPQGITIGKVTRVEWNHDTPLKTVMVEPAAYFKNIRKVAVLL
ncbi:MAG: rod shape-determining protein MreC [Clostridiales Family XIII bacterium]|jgi:rod shape-determining protein MreC|nr:rod shape-determining protein MreC [Clostridiales Family XIII bacterium]